MFGEDDTSSSSDREQNTSVNRRRLLKTLGAASGSIAIGSTAIGSVSASERDEAKRLKENLTMESVSSQKKHEKIDQVMEKPDVKQIRTRFANKGWTPNLNESKVLRTTYSPENNSNETTYYTVVVPFKKPAKDENHETFIRWSGLSDIEPVGYNIRKTSGTPSTQSKKTSGASSPEDFGIPDAEFTAYRVENGSVKTHVGETSDETNTDDISPSPQLICTPKYGCSGSLDFGCVSAAAAGVAGGSPSCKACAVDVTRISCIACLGVLYAGGYAIANCCNNGGIKCYQCCP